MHKITCPSCKRKHQTRGYPIICVKCGIHICPECGAELKMDMINYENYKYWDGKPCLVCGWTPPVED